MKEKERNTLREVQKDSKREEEYGVGKGIQKSKAAVWDLRGGLEYVVRAVGGV